MIEVRPDEREALRHLFLPDRPGNNRLDTLRNLLAGEGRVGMLRPDQGWLFISAFETQVRTCSLTVPAFDVKVRSRGSK